MSANINFVIRDKKKAILVPVSVVKDMPNGSKQVSVPGPDGKPVSKEVETGIESGDKVEITSGLEIGDMILITRGKYVPQQGIQSSPLMFSGPKATAAKQSSRTKK